MRVKQSHLDVNRVHAVIRSYDYDHRAHLHAVLLVPLLIEGRLRA